jgi:biopolymer transport protein ExbD
MQILEKASAGGKKARVTRRIAEEEAGLSITSLLDILTIVLVFLIKNVSMDAQKLTVPDQMIFPTTMTAESLEQNMGTTVIKVYPDRILVGVENVYFGTPQELLQDPQKRADLNDYLTRLSEVIEEDESKGEACLLVQADETIPAQYITAIVEIGTGSYYKYVYFSTLLDSNWLVNEAPQQL